MQQVPIPGRDKEFKGKVGEKGLLGDIGYAGERGEMGPVKLRQGLKGDKGDNGTRGLNGDSGDAGPMGPNGTTGVKGEESLIEQMFTFFVYSRYPLLQFACKLLSMRVLIKFFFCIFTTLFTLIYKKVVNSSLL